MEQGAYDYVNKPVRSLTELTLRIEQALSHRALVLENKAYQENLEHMVQDRTAELEQRMRELNGLNGILRTELNQNIGKDEDQRDYEVSYEKIGALGFKTTIEIDQGIDELLSVMESIDIENPYSNV